jgi:uracil-DNA glycosylase
MTVVAEHDLDAWRATARRLLTADVPPEGVTWLAADHHQDVLPLDDAPDDLPAAPARDRVPARFVAAAGAVVLHRDESKWAPLYRLLWYRPDHHIAATTADVFVDRFRSQRWSILTPDRSAHWDGAALTFGPGLVRETAPADDEMETLWRA